MIILKKHDRVEITYEGHTTDGVVLMASSNGVSLVLTFHGIIHGHVGMMPVVMEGAVGESIIDGTEVIVKKKDEP
jgi:hypothetical protein